MRCFRRPRFATGDAVFFTYGTGTVRSGIVQAEWPDGTLAVELDEASYPYTKGDALRIQRYNTVKKENVDE